MGADFCKCNDCGAVFEVLTKGKNDLVCCAKEMERLVPNTVDASLEKHVPVIERTKVGILVKVGSEPHPMIPEHYIMWIQIRYGGKIERKYLKPGDLAQAEFIVDTRNIKALEYCNIHQLWSNK